METISFSVDIETKKEIEKIAKEEKKSKSDVFRQIFIAYRFNKVLTDMQKGLRKIALKNNIQTDDDVERFLG